MIYLNVLNNLAKYNLVCRVLFIVVVWQFYVVLPNNTSQILGEAVYLGESAGQLFSGKKGKLANTLKTRRKVLKVVKLKDANYGCKYEGNDDESVVSQSVVS